MIDPHSHGVNRTFVNIHSPHYWAKPKDLHQKKTLGSACWALCSDQNFIHNRKPQNSYFQQPKILFQRQFWGASSYKSVFWGAVAILEIGWFGHGEIWRLIVRFAQKWDSSLIQWFKKPLFLLKWSQNEVLSFALLDKPTAHAEDLDYSMDVFSVSVASSVSVS